MSRIKARDADDRIPRRIKRHCVLLAQVGVEGLLADGQVLSQAGSLNLGHIVFPGVAWKWGSLFTSEASSSS